MILLNHGRINNPLINVYAKIDFNREGFLSMKFSKPFVKLFVIALIEFN